MPRTITITVSDDLMTCELNAAQLPGDVVEGVLFRALAAVSRELTARRTVELRALMPVIRADRLGDLRG